MKFIKPRRKPSDFALGVAFGFLVAALLSQTPIQKALAYQALVFACGMGVMKFINEREERLGREQWLTDALDFAEVELDKLRGKNAESIR
jgi:hypothetical protein